MQNENIEFDLSVELTVLRAALEQAFKAGAYGMEDAAKVLRSFELVAMAAVQAAQQQQVASAASTGTGGAGRTPATPVSPAQAAVSAALGK